MFVSVLLVWVVISVALACSTFTFDELKSVNYDIDILKTPVKVGEEQPLPVVHVTSKYGQRYQCLLPEIKEPEPIDKREPSAEEEIDIRELLKPIQSGPCLLKTKEWWTYEFCFGHYVKQYHIEDGKVIGQEITLGLYESDYDWTNETDQERFPSNKQRYHSQMYTNGTRCDLTGLPRTAEVRFYCEEDAGDYIFRVDEPGTCSYVMTIHTSRICSHPKLKPFPSNKAHLIKCNPLLDEKQYSLYLLKLNEEKTAAEKKRNKFLTTQHERLKVMKIGAADGLSEEASENPGVAVLAEEQDFANDETINLSSHEVAVDEHEEEEDEVAPIMKTTEHDLQREKFTSTLSDMQRRLDSVARGHDESSAQILEEKENAPDEHDTKDISFAKLASTLNMLLEKLDKAEKSAGKAATDDERVQASSGSSSADVKLVPRQGVTPRSPGVDDDRLRVRIRRLDRKFVDATSEFNDMDSVQRRKLEQAIKEKLEKSGLDTGGRRIEVNIITAGYYDSEDGKDFHALSDEETNQFQSMIMALLTGQQEAIQEMEKHKKLEENYRFVWTRHESEKSEEE